MIPLRFTQGDKSIMTCLPCVPRVGETVIVAGDDGNGERVAIGGLVATVSYVVNGGALDVFCEVAP